MLYFKNDDNTVTSWNGEPINGIRYPLSIEGLWNSTELATLNLYLPLPPDAIPDGKIATGSNVQVVDGNVKTVYTLEDAPAPPAPTGTDVDTERERRISLPLVVTTSVGSFSINMDPIAQRNLGGLASVGQYLVATSSTQTTTFRDFDNNSHDLTPADLVGMGLQVAQRIQAMYTKSWAVKALGPPIPSDYEADSYWT